MEERLKKIHSTGYWRVNIRPTQFDQFRIPSLRECREIVESSIVRLSGWDYPYLDPKETANGNDWIQSGRDFGRYVEYWQFYQSGQFIHHFACFEDFTNPEELLLYIERPSPSGHYLSILSTLYKVTEIYEFAARLASKDILSTEAEISIKLVGMDGRQLFFWSRSRYLSMDYICRIPEITFFKTYQISDLLTSASEFALDATVYIFERFNWTFIPRSLLAEEQKKLLERRL